VQNAGADQAVKQLQSELDLLKKNQNSLAAWKISKQVNPISGKENSFPLHSLHFSFINYL